MKSRLQNLKQIILDYLDGTKLMTGDTKSRELEEILQKLGTQYKKKKIPLIMVQRCEQTFFQRRHIYDRQVHEKQFNITHHRGTARQTHNKLAPHAC